MRKNWSKALSLAIFVVFFLSGNLFAGSMATVNVFQVDMSKRENSSEIVGTLYGGAPVEIERERGDKVQVSYNRSKGWIPVSALTERSEDFSNIETGVLLGETILREQDSDFLVYYYNEELHRLDIHERETEQSYEVGAIDDLHQSMLPSLYLLEGVYTNQNGAELHNFKIYDMKNQESVFIGSYDSDKLQVNKAAFSGDGNYLAMTFNDGTSNFMALYKSEDGSMIAYAHDVQNLHWLDNVLIMNSTEEFWYREPDRDMDGADLSYSREWKLMSIEDEWVVQGLVSSIVKDGILYVATDGETLAYDLETGETYDTDYYGLLFNESGTLNFYFEDDGTPVLRNVATANEYSYFSGLDPTYEFIQFVGDYAVYKYQEERIEALYLFETESGVEDYEYRAIDDIHAWGEDQIVAESSEDNDLVMIIIEQPLEERFFLIMKRGEEE